MIFEFDTESILAARIANLIEEFYKDAEPHGLRESVVSTWAVLYQDRYYRLDDQQRLFVEQLENAIGEPLQYINWFNDYEDHEGRYSALEDYVTSYLAMEEQAKIFELAYVFSELMYWQTEPPKNEELIDMLIAFTKKLLDEAEKGPVILWSGYSRRISVMRVLLGWLHEVRR